MSGTGTNRRGIEGQVSMAKQWKQRVASACMGLVLGVVIPSMLIVPIIPASATDATLLPNAKQQYLDASGNPVASGSVGYYIPSTTTKKTVWQDAAKTTPQTNPVPLDAAGRPQPSGQTFGDGVYRQEVKDADGLVIWDALTTSTGGGGSTPVTPTVGDGNLVGTVLPWSGFIAPPNYVFMYGQNLSRTGFPLLFATITTTSNLICTGGLNVLSGIADTSQIKLGAAVEVSCMPPGALVIAKATSSVTMSVNASVSTVASARFFPWGYVDATTFGIPDLRGRVVAGRTNMGGNDNGILPTSNYGTGANAIGAYGGEPSRFLINDNLPPYTPAGDITNGNITVNNPSSILGGTVAGTTVSAAGQSTVTQSTPIALTASQATSSFSGTPQGGHAIGFGIIQPTMTMNYIIKTLPDVSTAVATGVASLGGMTGVISCGVNIDCSSNTISALTAVTPPIVTSLVAGQYIGISVNDFGALNDGTTNSTRYIVSAATYANTNRMGLLLASGSNYVWTPIQFGGSNVTTATATGVTISGTTMTVPATPTGQFAPGQLVTCGTCTADTIITGYGPGIDPLWPTSGWIGTYTINNNQTVSASTVTVEAPSFTASIALDVMTVTAITKGRILPVDSLVGTNIIPGTTVVSQLTGSTGQTGTYRVSYVHPTPVTSTTVRSYPYTTVPIPDFINAALGGETQSVVTALSGNTSPHALVKIVDPPAIGAVLGFQMSNIRLGAASLYGNALMLHGFSSTSSGGQPSLQNLTLQGATASSCGLNVVGNNQGGQNYGVFEAKFSRLSGVQNTVCDANFDGYNGDTSHYIQALLMERMSANSASSGPGYKINFAELTCVDCLSQNHGGEPIRFGNVYHNNWINVYSEADIGAISSTANTKGVNMTGTVINGVDASMMTSNYNNINIRLGGGGTFPTDMQRNFGAAFGQTVTVKQSISSLAATPSGQGSIGASSTGGLQYVGHGSVLDHVWLDKNQDTICSVATGTTQLSCTAFDIGGKQIVLGGGFTMSGAFSFTGTLTGNTAVTFPNSGTLATTAGASIPSGTSGGILGYTSSTTLASSIALTQNALVLGGGAGATPTPMASLGTTTTVLHGNAAGAPTFAAVVSADMNITATSCTNQFVSAISTGGIGTCSTVPAGQLSGQVPLANGGTANNLTASNGGVFYSTASAGAILAGTATARQMLQSGASTTPAWSTATWPATTTINRLLYSSSANVISDLATANSAVLVTDSGGAPSLSTTLPNIALGTPSSITLTNGTGLPLSTGVSGTLQAAQEPAHTGDVTNTAGSLVLSIGATKVTSAMLNADVFSTAHSWSGGQTFTAPNLGTPASGIATNLTGLPISSGLAGAGTGVLTALAAAANASGGFATSPVANANLANSTVTVAGQTCTLGSTCGLTIASNVLGSNTSLNSTGSYFTGPTMAQGTSGTWQASGTVSLSGNAGDVIFCKMWDGTTVMSSGQVELAGNTRITMSFSGILATPASNIRIDCRDTSSTAGLILFNATGNSKDSTIFGTRVN